MPTYNDWTPERVLDLFVRSLSSQETTEAASREIEATKDRLKDATVDSVEEVLKNVSSLLSPASRSIEGTATVSALRQAFRLAAAVLMAFDPYRLNPVDMTAEPGTAARELVEDLITVYEPPSPREQWMLRPEVREAVLHGMGREQLLHALAANPQRPATLLQQTLETYIKGEQTRPLELEPLGRLAVHLQAVRWLQDTALSLPSPEEIQALIDRSLVPDVFQKMVGETFVDRVQELRLLRDYIGVLEPSSALENVRRQFRRWAGLTRQQPLVIYAPGGVGKTTLISKFLLEHIDVPDELKFPYIYLDFDNPNLSLSAPDTLLSEAIRQLSAQYPDARTTLGEFLQAARIQVNTQQRTSVMETFNNEPAQSEVQIVELAARFARLLGQVTNQSRAGTSVSLPLLLVLDTYEEVQVRGLDHEFRLWSLIESVQQEFASLRVVVFSRSPLERVPTSEAPTELLRLVELPQEVAEVFLDNLGVDDPSVARALYREVGGNPLSLKLAAESYRNGSFQKGSTLQSWRTFFLFSANENLVQGQLYQRILGHIHDPEVRQLAHPGLALRRITPELIKHVLQIPCGVAVPDDARAMQLFEALRKEVALVTADADGAVRARPDLRSLILKLIVRDKPKAVAEINRLAVAYYHEQEGLPARAEELYHRLQLCEPATQLEERWLPGVEEYLRDAIDEVPLQSRIFLASHLGIRLSPDDLKAAGLAEWERYTAQSAAELLRLGQADRALHALRERKQRTPGSPLHLIEARALAFQGKLKEAARAVRKALDAAQVSGDRQAMLEAVVLDAQFAQQRGDRAVADAGLEQAEAIAIALQDRIQQIGVLVQRAQLHLGDSWEASPLTDLRQRLARLLSALPDAVWIENRHLIRSGVSLLGFEYTNLVVRLLRRVGLGPLDDHQKAICSELVAAVVDDAEAQAVIALFERTLELSKDMSRSVNDLVSKLQDAERLDSFIEALLASLLANPERLRQSSEIFARLYVRQPFSSGESTV